MGQRDDILCGMRILSQGRRRVANVLDLCACGELRGQAGEAGHLQGSSVHPGEIMGPGHY